MDGYAAYHDLKIFTLQTHEVAVSHYYWFKHIKHLSAVKKQNSLASLIVVPRLTPTTSRVSKMSLLMSCKVKITCSPGVEFHNIARNKKELEINEIKLELHSIQIWIDIWFMSSHLNAKFHRSIGWTSLIWHSYM